ncbi:transposase [Amycolatopsis sp.]|uniref:transposase n=1 Tax=Amycolatopsis sp. TaxID=37632 RepID=UPI0039C8803B
MGSTDGSRCGTETFAVFAEFREAVAKEVVERSRSIAEVARDLGVLEQTLGKRPSRCGRPHVSAGSVSRACTIGSGRTELTVVNLLV